MYTENSKGGIYYPPEHQRRKISDGIAVVFLAHSDTNLIKQFVGCCNNGMGYYSPNPIFSDINANSFIFEMDTQYNDPEGYLQNINSSDAHVSFHKNGNTNPFSGVAHPMQNN